MTSHRPARIITTFGWNEAIFMAQIRDHWSAAGCAAVETHDDDDGNAPDPVEGGNGGEAHPP